MDKIRECDRIAAGLVRERALESRVKDLQQQVAQKNRVIDGQGELIAEREAECRRHAECLAAQPGKWAEIFRRVVRTVGDS